MHANFHDPMGVSPGCGPAAPRSSDPTVYLSPQSETVESPEFEVGDGRTVIRAFDLALGTIHVEMVHGHAEGKRYAPVVQNGLAWRLTSTHTLLVIDIPGRYRLIATGVAPGLQMPTVVVTGSPAWRASL